MFYALLSPMFFALFSSHRLIHLFWVWTSLKLAEDGEESVESCAQQGNYYTRRKWTKKSFDGSSTIGWVSDCWQPHMFCCREKKDRLSSFLFCANPNSHMCSNTSNFPRNKRKRNTWKMERYPPSGNCLANWDKNSRKRTGKKKDVLDKIVRNNRFPVHSRKNKNCKKNLFRSFEGTFSFRKQQQTFLIAWLVRGNFFCVSEKIGKWLFASFPFPSTPIHDVVLAAALFTFILFQGNSFFFVSYIWEENESCWRSWRKNGRVAYLGQKWFF